MKFLRRILSAVLLAVLPAALSSLAFAADNLAVTVGSGKTLGCKDVSAVCYMYHIIVDTTATALGTTGNPFITAGAGTAGTPAGGVMTIQGATSMTPINTTSTVATTGGCTPYHLAGGTAASTNSTSIKGSVGTLCVITAINTTATIVYLKVYDSASAPTCSSATNIKHVFPIPSGTSGNGFVLPVGPYGEAYANGIGYCVTGGGGDTDNTNAVTGIFVEASYK
jgi:hypothetical protein